MKFAWTISDSDKRTVSQFVDKQRGRVLIEFREKYNLAHQKEPVTRERFWRALVCMRLTTQARSGPTSKLAEFWGTTPFPLRYGEPKIPLNDSEFIQSVLQRFDVGRHPLKISDELVENHKRLEGGGWNEVLAECNKLVVRRDRRVEAEVANYIDKKFRGFGPKQSRNVLQALTLTRFEVPIDSRVIKWLNEKRIFPFNLTSAALADRNIYGFVLDGICELCDWCEICPCILDAAIFCSADKEVWEEKLLRF
jgi:hypothetical protein